MAELQKKILLIDTNCFIRLYFSPLLPLLGTEVAGYVLLTLDCLIDEFLNSSRLVTQYPWISEEPRISDLNKAKLNLRKPTRTRVQTHSDEIRPYAKSLLELYCQQRQITTRVLSSRDLELLATTVTLKGAMATDEWPLRHVAEDLMDDPEEYDFELFNSLEVLHLLEKNAKLTPDERRATVKSWLQNMEMLLKNWEIDYERLFNEPSQTVKPN